MRKENTILVIIITLNCANLCGCSYTSSYVAMNAVVESFYEGSQMISKVSLILNEKIIDYETDNTNTVVYYDNDIVFRNNTKFESRKISANNTLEFNNLDSDKIKQFIGIIFKFSGAFSEEELQIIDNIYEAYMDGENFETVYNGYTIKMTIKTIGNKKKLTIQYFGNIH